jgi:hypothetical protein
MIDGTALRLEPGETVDGQTFHGVSDVRLADESTVTRSVFCLDPGVKFSVGAEPEDAHGVYTHNLLWRGDNPPPWPVPVGEAA